MAFYFPDDPPLQEPLACGAVQASHKKRQFLAPDLMVKYLRLGSQVAVFSAASVAAAGAIKPADLLTYTKGPVALKPQFDLTETFNDNITYRSGEENTPLRNHDKESDFITTISPGLDLQVGRKDASFLDLSYTYDRLIYAKNSEFDANQHRFALVDRFRHNRLTLDGHDSIEFLSSPIGGGYSSTSLGAAEGVTLVGGTKVDRTYFFDLYRLTWDASERTDLYFQLLHSLVDYEKDLGLYDSQTLSETLGFEYRPFTKAYFFGEAYFGETDNTPNSRFLAEYPRANFVGFFVGARGQFTERLRGTAKAGYEHRFYSDEGDTLDTPVVEIGLDEQLTDKTLISLSYSRRQYESIQFVRSPYTTDAISASWTQQIGGDGRLRGILRGQYLRSSFEPGAGIVADRLDEIVNVSLTMAYDIKLWLRAFGTYSFERLDSNEVFIENYNVNRIALGLQVGY